MSPQLLALRHRQDAENGVAIKAYAIDLGGDTSTTFSRAVSNFITCTLESPERDPSIVTRNVRQFMSGMKNYLVTSGEKEFEAIVKRQRSNVSIEILESMLSDRENFGIYGMLYRRKMLLISYHHGTTATRVGMIYINKLKMCFIKLSLQPTGFTRTLVGL